MKVDGPTADVYAENHLLRVTVRSQRDHIALVDHALRKLQRENQHLRDQLSKSRWWRRG